MRTESVVAALLLLSCALPAHAQAGGSGVTESGTRDAFLTLIDRARVPLAPETRELPAPEPGLAAEHVTYAAEAGQRVPTLVVRPNAGIQRRPAVILLHGTGGRKESMSSYLASLARAGFVAVAIDGRYHGERTGPQEGSYVDAILRAYRTGGERPFLYDSVWDIMRLIDYLETRPDVDASRIGLMGISKGGMETYLAAAVDPRISAAVPIRGVQSFGWGLDHGAWDSRAWTFRGAVDEAAREEGVGAGAAFVRRFYDRIAPGIYAEFDGPAMLPLIAPRALLVVTGDSDPRTPMAGVRLSARAAQRAFGERGAPERFQLHVMVDTGHEDTPEIPSLVVDWFVRWLEPASP
jgi:dienelactone hydrolase